MMFSKKFTLNIERYSKRLPIVSLVIKNLLWCRNWNPEFIIFQFKITVMKSKQEIERTNLTPVQLVVINAFFISPHNLIFIPPRIYSTFDILSKTVPLFSVLNFENHNYIGGKKDNKNIFRLYFGPDLDFVTVCGIKGMVANCLCKRVLWSISHRFTIFSSYAAF